MSFGDVCVLSNSVEPDDAQLVVLKVQKKKKKKTYIEKGQQQCVFTQVDPQTLLLAVSWMSYYLAYHCAEGNATTPKQEAHACDSAGYKHS